MSLAAYPSEVLHSITIFLSGQSLIRLWRSGDQILRKKLTVSVSDAYFCDNQVLGVSRWPKMIDSLTRSTTLNISYDNCRLCDPVALWMHLSRLTHLKYLNLACMEAEEWLFESTYAAVELSNMFSDPEEHDSTTVPQNRMRPLQSTFPYLLSLELKTSLCVLDDKDLEFSQRRLRGCGCLGIVHCRLLV